MPEENINLDCEKLVNILLPNGRLQKITPDFETRNEQIDMLEEVVKCFNEDKIVLIEAGTGVGKSLAYLIPSFSWCQSSEERVVISTSSINLQEQIYQKDIPLVQKILANEGEKEVHVVIAKGRSHYVCLERVKEEASEAQLFAQQEWAKIVQWVQQTKTGDISELNLAIPESLWKNIRSDPDYCSEARCKQSDTCFFQKARREMWRAQIIITNHHLLFTDLALRSEGYDQDSSVILPPFQRVILDEAHNIESVARSCFSEELSRFHILKYLQILQAEHSSNAAARGLIAYLRKNTSAQFLNIESAIAQILQAYNNLEKQLMPYFNANTTIRLLSPSNYKSNPAQQINQTRNLQESSYNSFVADLLVLLKDLQISLQICIKILQQNYEHIEQEGIDDDRHIHELRSIIGRLQAFTQVCTNYLNFAETSNRVFWVEKKQSDNSNTFIQFYSAPIEVQQILDTALFSVFSGIVFTSATLTVGKSFDMCRARIGLSANSRIETSILGSPFNYEEQVLLTVPNDAPDPARRHNEFTMWLKQFILEVIRISEGHALVLCTSYSTLNAIYMHIKDELQAMDILCLAQGLGSRSALLSQFKDSQNSVLLATYSFWEGVDVPGDALKLLIISKLPFKVPTEPLQLAQQEAIVQRAGNPFVELSIPDAVMKLKQGFGRLMRRKTDSGVVIICDNRIVNKPYGQIFISSLPPVPLFCSNSTNVLAAIENHLYSRSQ